jgi:ATP-dependent helicase/nuclease subunit A
VSASASASPADRPPVDQPERDLLRTETGGTCFVEAGAGTGKTTTIVDRVRHLVETGHLPEIGGLAAITFTEAAAAELRDRLRRGLEQGADDPTGDDVSRGRCRAAVDAIDEASISTLHGFAQRLLAEYPIEAGVPPGFDVVDPIEAAVAFGERWDAFFDDLLSDAAMEPALVRALQLGARPKDLREVAEVFHDNWDRLRPPPPRGLAPLDVVPLIVALDDVMAAAEPCPADGTLRARVEADLAPFAAQLRSVAADGPATPGSEEELAVLEVLDHDWHGVPSRNLGGRNADAAAVHHACAVVADLRAGMRAAAGEEALVPIVARLVEFTLAGAAERRRRGRLEFHDLLVLAAALLRHHPEVRVALHDRITMVLVDEFQDTDPLQIEIATLLTLDDPTATPATWADAVLAPGRLFLVGDPQQTLYRFRRADIALYERAKAAFADPLVPLVENFRSVPAVIDWVNEVFPSLFDPIEGVQTAFRALHAHRPALTGDDDPAVAVLGGEAPKGTRAAAVRTDEADDVAAAIVAIHEGGGPVRAAGRVAYRDIAVLLPTRANLATLERALDAVDVPYRLESRSLVFSSDEVRELVAVLRAIDDPADEVALVAALRSPGFACSDRDLLDHRVAGGRWSYLRPVPDDVPPDHPVRTAMASLRELHRQRSWLPVNRVVDQVIAERGLVELTFARRRPRDHWRRLRILADEARAFVEAGGTSLGAFVAWCDRQADEQAARLETIVPEADDDAVRILTVHGAKGLEFPVVVLAGLNVGPPPLTDRVLWTDDGPEVRLGAKDRLVMTAGFGDAKAVEKQHREAERRRLLYVGATRAEEMLVLSLHRPPRGPTLAHDLGTLLEGADAVTDRWLAWAPPPVARAAPVLPTPASGSGDASVDLAADHRAWVAERARLLARVGRPAAVVPTGLASEVDATDEDVEPEVDRGVEPEPSDAAEPEAEPARPGRRGHAGTVVGRAVHGVLQVIDLTDPVDLDAVAAAQAAVEGIPDAADTVASLARAALASEPVREAVAGGRFWREVYVAAPFGDRVLEGYVDLLYERGDGSLVVVDYKTDRARSEAELDRSFARYRLQGAAYAAALEVALGRPVAEAQFVFVRPSGPVVRAVPELRDAMAEVGRLVGG